MSNDCKIDQLSLVPIFTKKKGLCRPLKLMYASKMVMTRTQRNWSPFVCNGASKMLNSRSSSLSVLTVECTYADKMCNEWYCSKTYSNSNRADQMDGWQFICLFSYIGRVRSAGNRVEQNLLASLLCFRLVNFKYHH